MRSSSATSRSLRASPAPTTFSRVEASRNAFLAACPGRALLDLISDKWVVLILCALSETDDRTAMRYSELSRRIAAVSPKMLTQRLRSLERDGLVTRTVVPRCRSPSGTH